MVPPLKMSYLHDERLARSAFQTAQYVPFSMRKSRRQRSWRLFCHDPLRKASEATYPWPLRSLVGEKWLPPPLQAPHCLPRRRSRRNSRISTRLVTTFISKLLSRQHSRETDLLIVSVAVELSYIHGPGLRARGRLACAGPETACEGGGKKQKPSAPGNRLRNCTNRVAPLRSARKSLSRTYRV